MIYTMNGIYSLLFSGTLPDMAGASQVYIRDGLVSSGNMNFMLD
jgi:hypothetical protein